MSSGTCFTFYNRAHNNLGLVYQFVLGSGYSEMSFMNNFVDLSKCLKIIEPFGLLNYLKNNFFELSCDLFAL
jgi:hypothetical protein